MDMEFEKITGSSVFRSVDIQQKSTIDRSTVQPKENKSTNEQLTNTAEVETVVSKMNDFIEPLRTNLKFVLHDELNEYYVTVVDPLTNEVIKEIPPKKMLDMYAAMAELMGIFIDQRI